MDLSTAAHTANSLIPDLSAYYPSNSTNSNCWSLIDGYLLVQARKADGTYVDVTQEWLSFGISRDTNDQPNPGQLNYISTSGSNPGAAAAANAGTNNAILKFQTYRTFDLNRSPNITNFTKNPPLPVPCNSPLTTTTPSCATTVPTWTYGTSYTPFDVSATSMAPNAKVIWPAVTSAGNATTTTYNGPAPAGSGQILSDQDPRKYYPINMWDPREGLFRDATPTSNGLTTGGTSSTYQCPAYGVINVVELDVNNLRRWLNGALAPTVATNAGINVESVSQNGYMLYYSDRRGMQPDTNAPLVPFPTGGTGSRITGGSLFEDVVNAGSGVTTGTPDGNTDTGEDSNQNGVLDISGAATIGQSFGLTYSSNKNLMIGTSPAGPGTAPTGGVPLAVAAYIADSDSSLPGDSLSCQSVGRKNRVLGARHALRLVNGTLNQLPAAPPAAGSNNYTGGGFTVASENPVYVLGEYNANAAQASQEGACSQQAAAPCHVSAAIIADAVTLLSNPGMGNATSMGYNDNNMWVNAVKGIQSNTANRMAQSTYYRMAIAGGKNMTFPQPSGTALDFGTDGGVHNFLRYIEGWSLGGGSGLHYTGSIVSLYYSEYSTALYKGQSGSSVVYTAPTRGYAFDIDFLQISLLPPGTPKFRDVENVGFQQIFTPY